MKTRRVLGIGCFFALVACGGGTTSGAPAPSEATDPTLPVPAPTSAPAALPVVDHGSVSATYPAFPSSMPTLVNHKGKVLAAPELIVVTWDGDPDRATFETLADEIGTSSYWSTMTAEYGVGAASSGPSRHVHETKALTLSNDPNVDPVQDIERFIVTQLSDTSTSHWPAPTPNSVYTLFVGGTAAQTMCQDAGGMHSAVEVKGAPVAYALVLECDAGDPTMTKLQASTVSASHEWSEAAVDPYPDAAPGWQGLSDDDLGWELLVQGQDENADLCEFDDDSYGEFAKPELASFVQRTWSNASAAAGHAPCVPALPKPYFNVSLLGATSVTAHIQNDYFPWNGPTRGYSVPVGQKKDVELGFASDGPTAPFTIEAIEVDPFDDNASPTKKISNPTLTVSLDKTTGQNGEKAILSVTVDKKSASGNWHVIVVKSTLPQELHIMPIVIVDE